MKRAAWRQAPALHDLGTEGFIATQAGGVEFCVRWEGSRHAAIHFNGEMGALGGLRLERADVAGSGASEHIRKGSGTCSDESERQLVKVLPQVSELAKAVIGPTKVSGPIQLCVTRASFSTTERF